MDIETEKLETTIPLETLKAVFYMSVRTNTCFANTVDELLRIGLTVKESRMVNAEAALAEGGSHDRN